MTTTTELTPQGLKLGAVLNTLPERVALARRDQIDYASFLQIILTDEIPPRSQAARAPPPEGRLRADLPPRRLRLVRIVTLDRRLLDAAFSLAWTATSTSCSSDRSAWARASSLRPICCCPGHSVRFVHGRLLQGHGSGQGRPLHGHSALPRPGPAHLDDLGLHRMTQQQSIDLYELVIARHVPPASSSPPTGLSTSGSSTTPSSATAPSTGSPTPATRSS